MTQLLNSFNPMNYDPSQGGGSWPLGKHPVIIESAEVKPTQDNSSGYLQLNLKIIDGQHAGFTGAYRLNLYNQSAKAAEVAHRQLSAVCHVTQTFQLGQDGQQVGALFGKPFVVECGYQKGEEPGPTNPDAKGYTEVKRVFDMNGNEPGKQGAQGAAHQQPAQGFQQQQQQAQQSAPQQQQQVGGAQAWGGQQNGQQAAQQPAQGGWGQQGGQTQQQAPQQGNGGGWAQQQGGGQQQGGPAWGQRS